MGAPRDVDVWAGLDTGKGEHFADVPGNDGERLFARAVGNDQPDLEALLARAARHGTLGLVIGQPHQAGVRIGPRTGARILAEIGGGSAFTSGSKLAACAGPAPVTRQSGTSLAGEIRSRRGNHQLKNALFPAAFASLRDPASQTFYDRKRAEGKRRNAALICLARRRCDVILAMLRTGQPHHPARRPAALAGAA